MPLVFFDIDGTLIQSRFHIWKGLMAYYRVHHRKRWLHTAFLGTHYPLYGLRKAGLLSERAFRARWSGDLGWYLRGESVAAVEAVGAWVAETYLAPAWRPETSTRLRAHLEAGDTVALVSAAPQPLVAAIARHLLVPHAIGTRFAVRDGRYTGKVIPPVALNEQKLALAQAHFAAQGMPFDLQGSYAYADSITDLALLEAVAHPVAVFPDDALRALALQRGWEIIAG